MSNTTHPDVQSVELESAFFGDAPSSEPVSSSPTDGAGDVTTQDVAEAEPSALSDTPPTPVSAAPEQEIEVAPVLDHPFPYAGMGEPAAQTIVDAETARHQVGLLVAEAKARGNGEGAAALWLEAGLLHERVLDEPREAATAFQHGFTACPSFSPVLHAAIRLFAKLGNWRMVALLLDEEQKARPHGDIATRLEKAAVLADRLGKPDEASALYREILADAPAHIEALLSWRTLNPQSEDWLMLARQAASADEAPLALKLEFARSAARAGAQDADEAWAAVLRVAPDSAEALTARNAGDEARDERALAHARPGPVGAIHLIEAARAAMASGDLDGAQATLVEAVQRAPGEIAPLRELEDLHRLRGDLGAYAALLTERAALVTDPRLRAALLFDAAIAIQRAEAPVDDIVVAFEACLGAQADHRGALAALGKLFASSGNVAAQASIIERELEHATGPSQRLPRLFHKARLAAGGLGDVDGALAAYHEILKLVPGEPAAVSAVEFILESAERWTELASHVRQRLETEHDPVTQSVLWQRLAGLRRDKLADPAGAAEAFARALDFAPSHVSVLDALLDVKRGLGDDAAVLDLLARRRALTSDPRRQVASLLEEAAVLGQQPERLDDAVASYEAALQLEPGHVAALGGLGRLLARASRHDAQIALYQRQIDAADAPAERARLWGHVAQIRERHLDDVDGAVAAYEAGLAEAPSDFEALHALQRVLLSAERWQGYIAALAREQLICEGIPAKVGLWMREASVLEHRLGDIEGARAALERAVQLQPDSALAFGALRRVLERLGDTASLQSHFAERGAAHLSDAAYVALRTPGSPTQALRAALEHQPDAVDLQYAALFDGAARGDFSAVRACAQVLIEAGGPETMQLAPLCVRLSERDDDAADPMDTVLPWLKANPESARAMRIVERLYEARGSRDGLLAVHRAALSRASSTAAAAAAHVRIGDLHACMGDLAAAERDFASARDAFPGSLVALWRLRALFEARGDAHAVLGVLREEAQAIQDAAQSVAKLMQVGAALRDVHGDLEGAAACFTQVLGRDADHAEAYQAAESLLVTHGMWDKLAELYAARAHGTASESARVENLLKTAMVLADRLSRQDAALAAYEQVLELVPNHPTAVGQAAALSYRLERWERALVLLQSLVGLATDPATRFGAQSRIGHIYLTQKNQPKDAINAFVAALALAPEDRGVRRALAESYERTGAIAQALGLYEQLVQSAGELEERLGLLDTVAALHESHTRDLGKAAAALKQALQLVEGDAAAEATRVEALASLYERAGDLDGYLGVATRHAGLLESKDGTRAAAMWLRVAHLLAEKKGDPQGAIKAAQRAIDLAPDDVEARGFLADLYSGMPNQVLLAVEEHRRILARRHVRAASLRSLRQAWQSQRAFDRAYVAAEVLAFLHAADEGEELYLSDNRRRMPEKSDEALETHQLASTVVHKAHRNVVTQILIAVGDQLGKVEPDDLSLYQVARADVLKPKSGDTLRRLCDAVARQLGGPQFEVHRTREKPHVVRAHHAAVPAIVVGAEVTRRNSTREQRFLLGQQLGLMRLGLHLVQGKSAADLKAFIAAIGKAVDKTFPAPEHPALEADVRAIDRALSRATRRALVPLVDALAGALEKTDFEAYAAHVDSTAARCGLLVCGDFGAAMRLLSRERGVTARGSTDDVVSAVQKDAVLTDLVGYAVSDDYFMARQALRMAIDV